MLKWAVNGPRQSYLPTVGENRETHNKTGVTSPIVSEPAFCDKRKSVILSRGLKSNPSSDVCSLRQKLRGSHNKENRLTSTPLSFSLNGYPSSPSRKTSCGLKDLSNITADHDIPRNKLKRKLSQDLQFLCQTPEPESLKQRSRKSVPENYASTLPTFDVEYSPSGLVPGPILALRGLGVGIADTYFEKPRYLTRELPDIKQRNGVGSDDSARPMTFSKDESAKLFMNDEDCSMSSSKMGDTTLEHMIDAILESARKERKILKYPKQTLTHRAHTSPTYTPADDPASDLHEYWDATKKEYRPGQTMSRVAWIDDVTFNEREVCSPLAVENHQEQQTLTHISDHFQLRRQRAVRRKRKLETIAGNAETKLTPKVFVKDNQNGRDNNRPEIDYAVRAVNRQIPDVPPMNQLRNISPDSGRNSSSDYDDSTQEGNVIAATPLNGVEDKSNTGLNATKRRLDFSVKSLDES